MKKIIHGLKNKALAGAAVGAALVSSAAHATPTAIDGLTDTLGEIDLSSATTTVQTMVVAILTIFMMGYGVRLIKRFVKQQVHMAAALVLLFGGIMLLIGAMCGLAFVLGVGR